MIPASKVLVNTTNEVMVCGIGDRRYSHLLAVRKPASHAGNRGSIPLGATLLNHLQHSQITDSLLVSGLCQRP